MLVHGRLYARGVAVQPQKLAHRDARHAVLIVLGPLYNPERGRSKGTALTVTTLWLSTRLRWNARRGGRAERGGGQGVGRALAVRQWQSQL